MTPELASDATAFFADLEADNSTSFWQVNKDRYAAEVRTPFAAIHDMPETDRGPFKTFYMHRNMRFSADKSPFKTMHGADSCTCPYRCVQLDRDDILLAEASETRFHETSPFVDQAIFFATRTSTKMRRQAQQ